MSPLHPKTILITGCSTGIGYATALHLKSEGWQVFAGVRKPEDMERLSQAGLEAILLDVDDSSSIRDALTSVLAETNGQLTALFNNAGYGQPGAVEDVPRTALAAQFNTNVFGVHELMQQVLPIMRAQGYGTIINNSSILGHVTFGFRGAYNASKFALEGLTDTLRVELHDTNINVVLLAPGPITSQFRATAHQQFLKHIDYKKSAFSEQYEAVLARLANQTQVDPFTLPSEACAKVVAHILTTKRPKARYFVTKPAHVLGRLKHLIPTPLLDKLLIKLSGL